MNKKQFRNITEYGIGTITKTTSLLEETACGRATPPDAAASACLDEFPTLELFTIDIDQLPTQVGLPIIPSIASSQAFQGTIDISIHDQVAGLLPAISGLDTARNQTPPSTKQTTTGESYLGLIGNLVKNSGIYAVSSLASPFITLALSPFLAHMLSHVDYGALAVLTTVVALVTGVSELGLGAAFTRFYRYDCKTEREQLDVLSTLALLLLVILIPTTAVGVIVAPWLSVLILGTSSYSNAIQVVAVLVLSQNMTVPGLVWLRVEGRAAFFSTIFIANLLMTAGATIVLVGGMQMGVGGALAANGFGDIIIIVCTLPIIFWRAGFHLRFALAGSMLAFGIPNVTNLISGWVLQLSDRYLLGHFASLSLAAGYSVAYTLGGALTAAIIAPFLLAWWVMMYPIAEREDAKQIFKLIFRGFSFVLLFATLGLSLFGSSVLDLLFPVSYHGQSSIIPVIALSNLFYGLFNVVNLGTSLQYKTWLTSVYFIVSALLNVGLNIVLIPAYGAMGAALATLVAYITLTLTAYLGNQRIYRVPFETDLFLIALAIAIVLYFADSWLIQGQNSPVAWDIHIGALLLYGFCLLFLGWLLPIVSRTHSFPYIYRHSKSL